VKESGAYWTKKSNDETVDEFAEKLAGYAKAWGELADEIWAKKHSAQPAGVKAGDD